MPTPSISIILNLGSASISVMRRMILKIGTTAVVRDHQPLKFEIERLLGEHLHSIRSRVTTELTRLSKKLGVKIVDVEDRRPSRYPIGTGYRGRGPNYLRKIRCRARRRRNLPSQMNPLSNRRSSARLVAGDNVRQSSTHFSGTIDCPRLELVWQLRPCKVLGGHRISSRRS